MDISDLWGLFASVAICFVGFEYVFYTYFRRLSTRRSWAVAEAYALWLLQLVTGLMAGLTATLVWWSDDDQTGFNALLFTVLMIFAIGQWFEFGQCCYWARWLLLAAFLGWLGVTIWAGIIVWYAVFSAIAALFCMGYWFMMAWSIRNIYGGDVPPIVIDEPSPVPVSKPRKAPSKPKIAPAPPPQQPTQHYLDMITHSKLVNMDCGVNIQDHEEPTVIPMHSVHTTNSSSAIKFI